jgi:hypothetical protein
MTEEPPDLGTHEKNIPHLRRLVASTQAIGCFIEPTIMKEIWDDCLEDIANLAGLNDRDEQEDEDLLAYREIADELREHF